MASMFFVAKQKNTGLKKGVIIMWQQNHLMLTIPSVEWFVVVPHELGVSSVMGVSQKWMICKGKSPEKWMMNRGTPHLWKTPNRG